MRGCHIVLQIGSRAMDMVDNDATKLADRLFPYLEAVDDILIDSSGGRGELFDSQKAIKFLSALREKYPGLGLGVAGGLGAKTIILAEELFAQFPGLSVDAQDKLRDPGSDDLDLMETQNYLRLAEQLSMLYEPGRLPPRR